MRRIQIVTSALLLFTFAVTTSLHARQREPNGAYAERRAKLLAQVDGPVVLFGFTGKENDSPSYVFNQEENFYYLTGHNEAGAVLLLVPAAPNGKGSNGTREILFLPPRDRMRERWDGPRIGPADPDVQQRTGFAEVKAFADLRAELERLGKVFTSVYTLLPRDSDEGYPHARTWQYWLYQILPQSSFRDARPLLGAMRQIKSPTELALLERAVELSMDAHLEAMKMMRPGIYEYEVAARMEYIHKRGGCEGEAYAPIVGSGLFSTVLHYNAVDKKIEAGDVIVLDVGGQYSGYAADITRTLPASGKFTARQREIYEIVLGAQKAVLAALKPGMSLSGRGTNSLHKIAYDYINAHGKDKDGKPLGRYFIHGLGHHVGLNVHDPGDSNRVLEPGMVVTIEPGIYIPEENLGVRIEDMVLITADGYKLLTARLPRDPDEVEKVMAEARKKDSGSRSQDSGSTDLLGLCVENVRPVTDGNFVHHLRNLGGRVALEVEVDPAGIVRSVAVKDGHALLSQLSLENALGWKFCSQTGGQRPVVKRIVEFRFEGNGGPVGTKQVFTELRPLVVVGFN